MEIRKSHNYTKSIIDKAIINNELIECNDKKYIDIICEMNKNLEIAKREYKIKQIQSIESASKITLI